MFERHISHATQAKLTSGDSQPKLENESQSPTMDLYGPFLVVVGGLFIALAMQLKPTGMMNQRDIGPQVVPMSLAIAMLFAGLLHMVTNGLRYWTDERNDPRQAVRGVFVVPSRPLVVVALLILWVIVMPHLGFVASGLLFTVSALKLMRARWMPSLLAAAVMVPIAHVLFVEGFHVVLPMGPWGF